MNNDADDADNQTDQSAAQIINGRGKSSGGLRHKGSKNQAYHSTNHEDRRNIVVYRSFHLGGDGLHLFAEQKQEGSQRNQSAKFHAPEDTGLPQHPEEVQKGHTRIAAQKNAGGIAYQGCRSLEV